MPDIDKTTTAARAAFMIPHGPACPCGACAGIRMLTITPQGAEIETLLSGDSVAAITPAVSSRARQLGISTRAQVALAHHFCTEYGEVDGLALDAVFLTKLGLSAPDQRARIVRVLNSEVDATS